jgi:hypothetical protein
MRSDELIDHTGGNRRRDNQMTTYRKTYEVVGYTYEAAEHCVMCTIEAVRNDPYASSIEEWTDREGNEAHPIFLDQLTGNNYCDDCSQDLSY